MAHSGVGVGECWTLNQKKNCWTPHWSRELVSPVCGIFVFSLKAWKDSGFGIFQEMTQETGRSSASCQLAFCKKAPPLLLLFKPICSRVRSVAGPRAVRKSLCRAAGLLAAILTIRGVTRLQFLAEFFRILGDFLMGFAKLSPNSGLKNSLRKLSDTQFFLGGDPKIMFHFFLSIQIVFFRGGGKTQ